jgi:hypothetical protein
MQQAGDYAGLPRQTKESQGWESAALASRTYKESSLHHRSSAGAGRCAGQPVDDRKASSTHAGDMKEPTLKQCNAVCQTIYRTNGDLNQALGDAG